MSVTCEKRLCVVRKTIVMEIQAFFNHSPEKTSFAGESPFDQNTSHNIEFQIDEINGQPRGAQNAGKENPKAFDEAFGMVPAAGVEPARVISPTDFELFK